MVNPAIIGVREVVEGLPNGQTMVFRTDDPAADEPDVRALLAELKKFTDLDKDTPVEVARVQVRSRTAVDLIEALHDWHAMSERESATLRHWISADTDFLTLNAVAIAMGFGRERLWGLDDPELNRQALLVKLQSIRDADLPLWLERSGAEALGRLAELEESARQAVGATASDSLAGLYQDHADREGRFAEWLRWASVAAVVVGGFAAWKVPAGDDLGLIVRHVGIALSAFVIAAYLGRQSAQHRFVAREYRATEVRLKTLPGFAESLDDPDLRTTFLDRVGISLFTTPIAQPGKESDAAADAQSLLEQVVALVQAAGPRKPPA